MRDIRKNGFNKSLLVCTVLVFAVITLFVVMSVVYRLSGTEQNSPKLWRNVHKFLPNGRNPNINNKLSDCFAPSPRV